MRFGILGPVAAWTDDGRDIRIGEAKVRLLLAALLLDAGHVVSTDRLGDIIWFEKPPRNPQQLLHTKVWQLRRALAAAENGADRLVQTAAPGYRLDMKRCELDEQTLQRLSTRSRAEQSPQARIALLTEALSLFRGPVLADFTDEPFASAFSAKLEEQRLSLFEDRLESMLEAGDHATVVGESADLVASHPFRERLRAAQMTALYRCGRQPEALQAFDEHRKRLIDELGVTPSSHLAELRQSILKQDPALSPSKHLHRANESKRPPLPKALTPLVGRADTMATLPAIIRDHRLTTLIGPAGVGKTRLAIELAHRLPHQVCGDVWLVDLAQIHAGTPHGEQGAAIVELICGILQIRAYPASPEGQQPTLLGQLGQALTQRKILLVLDNCEHVIDPVADITQTLLGVTDDLRVLATSQEPLGVPGEKLWLLEGLPIRDDRAAGGAEPSDGDAVDLFSRLVVASIPDFRIDDSNRASVIDICRRLDGLPLALELAATRVRALGVSEVSKRLRDRFALLVGGRRGGQRRHHALETAIAWSWNLLSPPEKTLMRRLSVLGGTWDLGVVEAICVDDALPADQVPQILARLVDRSLVAVMPSLKQARRFRLLESVAAYAAERLDDAGETTRTQNQLLSHATASLDAANAGLRSHDQRDWLQQLDADSGWLRRALGGATTGAAHQASRLRLLNGLAWYWYLRGNLAEAIRMFSGVLNQTTDNATDEHVTAQVWAAVFQLRAEATTDSLAPYEDAWRATEAITEPLTRGRAQLVLTLGQLGFGSQTERRERTNRVLAQLRAAGDAWGEAVALTSSATQHILSGDLTTAHSEAQDAHRRLESLGDAWGQLQALRLLAQLADIEGDHGDSARLHREGLRLAEGLGLWVEASLQLSGLGRVALAERRYRESADLHDQALRLATQQGFPFGMQFAEVGLGMTARRVSDYQRSEEHLTRWLDWCRQLSGHAGAALILAELGFAAEQQGQTKRALRLHLQGLTEAQYTQDDRAVALAVEGLAGAFALAGNHRLAATLIGAAQQARAATGAALPQAETTDVDRVIAACTTALGRHWVDALRTEGAELGLTRAIHLIEETLAAPISPSTPM